MYKSIVITDGSRLGALGITLCVHVKIMGTEFSHVYKSKNEFIFKAAEKAAKYSALSIKEAIAAFHRPRLLDLLVCRCFQ